MTMMGEKGLNLTNLFSVYVKNINKAQQFSPLSDNSLPSAHY